MLTNHFDEHEDDGSKSSRNDWSHAETGKDSTKSGSLAPSPLNLAGSYSCNTDTGNRRDQGVCRGNVGRVAGTPHHPDGSTCGSACEGKQLHASVTIECLDGDTVAC